MRRSHLRAVSPKQRAKNAEWKQAREAALARAHYWPECSQVGLPGECAGGVEVHHRLRRSQGGTNDLENLLCVCREHHRLIHDNPEESYARGWLIRSGVPS